ncbi:uncharacterized protein LOC142232809 isoform X2 [Haematobia irritans]
MMNPFDPRVVPHVPTTNMTHISSNGYYGFSYINAAHDIELNNNNNNNNNNIDITNNNNTSATHNFMANDANGTTTTLAAAFHQQQPASRCKKRFFVDANNASVFCDKAAVAKRCRYDDDIAEYCNDFFSLPSTQIATQSCLMDTTEEGIQQQQEVDEAINNTYSNHSSNNSNCIGKYEQGSLHLQLQQQQQQQLQHEQSQMQAHQPPTQLHNQPQQHHYQDMIISKPPPNHHSLQITEPPEHKENVYCIDDVTLFANLHGGCLYNFVKSQS